MTTTGPRPVDVPAGPVAPTAGALVLEDVGMRYPGRGSHSRPVALDGVSMSVRSGEIVALLGRNGAGKSTLVRIISTVTIPTSGRVRVGGHDAVADDEAVRRVLGVALGGERSVYWKLTGRQNLEFFAALRGLRGRARGEAVERALAQVDLTERADDHAENYSTGMRQRLVIARALVGDPAVVVLDEPSAGLDPHASAALLMLVERLRDQGRAVLVTTHHVEEAEQVADRVAVLDGGRLVALDTPAALRSAVGGESSLTCELSPPRGDDVAALVASLGGGLQVLATAEGDDGRVTATLSGRLDDAAVAGVMTRTVERGWVVHALRVEPVTLRHAFLRLTGREITEDSSSGEDDGDDD